MSIVIWLCFAIMIAILATSIVNIARRGRADRLEYYKNYKEGQVLGDLLCRDSPVLSCEQV